MTSLSLFPRALALSAYSAVSGSRMTLCLAISCRALFACRSPPLLSLCLTVLPLEAGIGQAPHIAANDAWIGNTYLDDSGRDSPASLNSTGDM